MSIAATARYGRTSRRIVVDRINGRTLAWIPRMARGLETATETASPPVETIGPRRRPAPGGARCGRVHAGRAGADVRTRGASGAACKAGEFAGQSSGRAFAQGQRRAAAQADGTPRALASRLALRALRTGIEARWVPRIATARCANRPRVRRTHAQFRRPKRDATNPTHGDIHQTSALRARRKFKAIKSECRLANHDTRPLRPPTPSQRRINAPVKAPPNPLYARKRKRLPVVIASLSTLRS